MGLGLAGRVVPVWGRPRRVLGLRRAERGGTALLGGAVMRSSDVEVRPVPRRCSMRAFCFCLTVSMDLTCSMLSRLIARPITTGEMGVELVWSATGRRSVSRGWGAPLMVTRRFLRGEEEEAGDGGETSGLSAGGGEHWSCSCLICGEARLDRGILIGY